MSRPWQVKKMRKRYIIFHKPYGILSQFTSDSADDNLSVFQLPKDVYAAGRLDKDSEGLLLLTNDGEFIKKISDPKFEKEKTYWAQVENIPTNESLNKFQNGLKIEDYTTKRCQVHILENMENFPARNPPIRERKNIPTCWLEITISEGKNRQVRKMTAAIGHPTLRLIRVKIGKYSLSKSGLAPGQWKEVLKNKIL
jgi:23S rRNA pseudouridine2457 synthase